ncbi:VWA domain-containing protein, partial [bacterium]|nr:VWA domain-containing protein [candidate division CSSED10-310 bacterium]
VTTNEMEPNQDLAAANLVDVSATISGTIQDGPDRDAIEFTIGEGDENRCFDILVEAAPAVELEAKLYYFSSEVLTRSAEGRLVLDNLLLPLGMYQLQLRARQHPSDYTIRFQPRDTTPADHEVEPNDRFEFAAGMGSRRRINGGFNGREKDFFRFTITGPPVLMAIAAEGTGIQSMEFYNAAGQMLSRTPFNASTGRAELTNLYLHEGSHWVAVKGEAGDYSIAVRSLGPLDPSREREPNDDASRAMPVAPGMACTGSLLDGDDVDSYRFFLAAEEHLFLTAIPGESSSNLALELFWAGLMVLRAYPPEAGGVVEIDTMFPPGEYLFSLRNKNDVSTDYEVRLQRRDPFMPPKDMEPNSDYYLAAPFPTDHVLEGRVGELQGDRDVYLLPVSDIERTISFQDLGRLRVTLLDVGDGRRIVSSGLNQPEFNATVPAGQQLAVSLSGDGAYRIPVVFTPPLEATVGLRELPVDAAMEFTTRTVAAYRREGQRLTGVAKLMHRGTEPVTVRLGAKTSHYNWRCWLDREEADLAPGAEVTIPLVVEVGPDAWAGEPVVLWLHIASGPRVCTVQAELTAGLEASPVAPGPAWPLPSALLGGYNVAAARLGAVLTNAGRDHMEHLIDGMTPLREGFSLRPGERDRMPVIDPPGDEPIPVAGLTLNPQSKEPAARCLKDFQLSASNDGRQWTVVYQGTLSPLPHEQAFAFDTPVTANYFKLDMLDSHWNEPRTNIGLGEWKLIAVPGIDPFDGVRHNLAAIVNGGHVVWAEPEIATYWDNTILTEDREEPYIRLLSGKPGEWVIGFEHERAARIDEVQWVKSGMETDKPEATFTSVMVAVSVASPFGPWMPAGEMDPRSPGEMVSLRLAPSVWARYVKFTAAGGEGRSRCYPDTIRILEQPMDETYRSILTEWGHYHDRAIYEYLVMPEEEKSIDDTGSGHDSMARALVLAMGERGAGRVKLGEREDWYRVRVPAGGNTLTVTVTGDPDVRVECTVLDRNGGEIPSQSAASLDRMVITAAVDGGCDYFIRITDPPRSIIISWDTSGSVAPYIPVTYNALNRFTQDVTPGLEVINFLPFGGSLLLDRWMDQPLPLQAALTEYDRRDDSSAAETTLAKAARALSKRSGAKAVVFITDAATPRDRTVWPALAAARPRVFSLALSSGGSMGPNVYHEQDLMQSWARVNSGYYEYVRTQGELDRGFERAATWLRRPAGYGLTVAASHVRAPGPGTLAVVTGTAKVTSGGAVELILDASGSMLKRMGGRRRIEIAKEVLGKVVTEHLPAGIPLALRVFGHKQPNACHTELLAPLAPLNPGRILGVLDRINAMNLAKTPIAESLQKVATDLAKVDGKRVVVLVTDGEETCDGDPEKEIQALIDKGFDIRINIVGFAIDDQELAERFQEWAALGGGRYFDGDGADELDKAVQQALRIPFEVFDGSGGMVAAGMVDGGPVTLPAGEYRVAVQSEPPMEFDPVAVPGDGHLVLDLGRER